MGSKQIAIAIQGGGIQSAFAWGVVDLLLKDERIDITGISTTGLGGMSGAAIIQGLLSGGRERARSLLRDYWIGFFEASKKMAPLIPNPLEEIINYYNFIDMPSGRFKNGISPYDKNPLNINPLLDFVESFFDFEILNSDTSKKLFISTTHVETGKIKIFSNKDMCSQVLMASFCLPYVFHAVEINGEHYWDGGLVANPAINPIIDGVTSRDIVVIQLSRNSCYDVPTSFQSIENRIREINNNAHLLREMRAIYFISKLIDGGKVVNGALKRINMHVVRNECPNYEYKKLVSDWGQIMDLYTAGHNSAKKWLTANFDSIGNTHSELSDEVFGAYI